MKSKLKLLLVERNRTMRWLADELGVHEVTVGRWCTDGGIEGMSLKTAERVANAVGCRVPDLFEEGGGEAACVGCLNLERGRAWRSTVCTRD